MHNISQYHISHNYIPIYTHIYPIYTRLTLQKSSWSHGPILYTAIYEPYVTVLLDAYVHNFTINSGYSGYSTSQKIYTPSYILIISDMLTIAIHRPIDPYNLTILTLYTNHTKPHNPWYTNHTLHRCGPPCPPMVPDFQGVKPCWRVASLDWPCRFGVSVFFGGNMGR